jgi:hypothetical protein
MIVVLAELGGKKLLGKARELADASGDRVLALVREGGEIDPQHLVYLGADEVLTCKASATSGLAWTAIFLELLKKETILLIMLPSNLFSNEVLGGVGYALGDKCCFLDDAEMIDASSLSKSFRDLGVVVKRAVLENKVALTSIKLSSVPEPFEDTSRYGKVKSFELHSHAGDGQDLDFGIIQSSANFCILLGTDDPKLAELAKKMGEKYGANVRGMSGKVQVVYSSCLAIEVKSRMDELPVFKGPLLALNSAKAPIFSVADTAAVSEDVERVLELML